MSESKKVRKELFRVFFVLYIINVYVRHKELEADKKHYEKLNIFEIWIYQRIIKGSCRTRGISEETLQCRKRNIKEICYVMEDIKKNRFLSKM